jgi:hypothetical protein
VGNKTTGPAAPKSKKKSPYAKAIKRSEITTDPNREDDEEYIVRLVGQVIKVSLETVKIVNALPAEFEPKPEK